MLKQDIRVLFICYRILPRLRTTGIPSVYCFRIDQLVNLINQNKQYRIIVVCKAKHIRRLNNIITGRCIHEIYTLGHCEEHQITNKEITTVNTNEQDLIFQILCATIRYAHHEELIQRKLENYGLANALTTDVLKLLQQIEVLL